MSKKLNLCLVQVRCVDETGGSWAEKFGDDEIYLGGFGIDSANNTNKINPFSVRSDFDDNETHRYNPPKVFASFDLGGNFTSPRSFAAGFLMIEKDSGDMTKLINNLYTAVVDEIRKRRQQEEARIANLPRAGGVALRTIPLGMIWSVVKPIVYAYVVNKLVGWFGDEVFPLQDVTTTITGPDHTWNGKNTSPVSMVEFRGHGGHYQLSYIWEIK